MGMKSYIFFSFLYFVIIGAIAYSFVNSSYAISIFSHQITLPIVVWLLLPAIVLFFVTTFHMLFYVVKNYFGKRAYKKDYETILEDIKNSILDEDKKLEYKTEIFESLSHVTKKLIFNPLCSNDKIESKSLNDTFEILKKIYNGEYVDIKKFRLRGDNPITIQNKKNILNSNDKKLLLESLKQCSTQEDNFCKYAFKRLVESATTFSEIKKYDLGLSGENANTIFERFVNDENFLIPTEEIKNILENTLFTKEEYLISAKLLCKKVDPDSLVTIYENIQSQKCNAAEAYLYVLFEFEMIDKIRYFLDNTDENEFLKYKILLFLRDNGKIIDKDLII